MFIDISTHFIVIGKPATKSLSISENMIYALNNETLKYLQSNVTPYSTNKVVTNSTIDYTLLIYTFDNRRHHLGVN